MCFNRILFFLDAKKIGKIFFVKLRICLLEGEVEWLVRVGSFGGEV